MALLSQILTSVCTQKNPNHTTLKAFIIETAIGPMVAIADEQKLHLLEYFQTLRFTKSLKKLQAKNPANFLIQKNDIIEMISDELTQYFTGSLKIFKTPIQMYGTNFQLKVWRQLLQIPYGYTMSYLEQSQAIGQDSAFRAVANANAANLLSIIVPCHRVINQNGNLGGYGGGLEKKKCLLQLETNYHYFMTSG